MKNAHSFSVYVKSSRMIKIFFPYFLFKNIDMNF